MQVISRYEGCGVMSNGEKLTRCICWPCRVGHRGYTKPLLNTLNAELNPICCLLALLGAHHFLHVSRVRVKVWCITECHEQSSNWSNLFVVAEIMGDEYGYIVDGWCM